ncbi:MULTISPECIES: diacylglycerol kinase [unclassified Rhodoferax]|uniref:diacylglycerol kinase n=1 Tax=unclassified Rhodoferax TaxID=2627954 RepID=UPI0015D3DFBB|nr:MULTISPECIES: diacylglycerol kinase [unclassified Rhodoferax]MBT3066560.1 diacylglycerol kinase [Rhodoferax sp. U11-2br]
MSDSEKSPFKGKTGLSRIVNAATYSLQGLQAAWADEAAFRQVCLLALVGLVLMAWLPLSAHDRVLIVFAHVFSIVVELINSAIEAAVDHTSLKVHPMAKRAKDLGSAAQLVSLLNMAAIWLIVLLG